MSFVNCRPIDTSSEEVVCRNAPEMIISVWPVWVSEPSGGGEKSERDASCWEGDTETHTKVHARTNKQTNKSFQTLALPADLASPHAHARTHTHGSNWGVVKEAASLISSCLPHCPAAFTRNSLRLSLSLCVCRSLSTCCLLLQDVSCSRKYTDPTRPVTILFHKTSLHKNPFNLCMDIFPAKSDQHTH